MGNSRNSMKVLIAFSLLSFVSAQGNYTYSLELFEVSLDHFSFTINEKFPIRVLVNDSFWERDNSGPIFFYTGNEGHVESFAQNTGFMWEIAREFGAVVLFVEHRFYGGSIPSDELKIKLKSVHGIDVIGYLSMEQALADFAEVITAFKKQRNAESSPVIAFGGSYGGILSAYVRLKYPHIVQGGIASSAPFYLQNVPCDIHDKILTSVFAQANENCVSVIRKSWSILRKFGKSAKGRQWINNNWKICDSLKTYHDSSPIKAWLESMYSLMGMVNYPYAANFVQDLPANPVKKFCSFLNETDLEDDKELMSDLFQAIGVYINNTGKTDCFDYSDQSMYSDFYSQSDDTAFDFQSCTELIDPSCDNGISDFFEPSEWDFDNFSATCFSNYNVRPQPQLVDLFFGGRNLLGASNIVFSNGLLDAWHGYGVLKNLSDTLRAVVMTDAAHHLDLRASNPADPTSVVAAREFEKSQIRKWLAEFHKDRKIIQEANLDDSSSERT